MLTVETLEVAGWLPAIVGMRNPLNSWDKADTVYHGASAPDIGKADMELMQKLIKGGTEERKYLRMIAVYMNVDAPLYW